MAKTIGAVAVLAALAAAYAWIDSRPEKGEPGPRPRPFGHIDKADLGKFEIVHKGEKVVLVPEGDGGTDEDPTWRVAEPVDYPADDYAIKQLLDRASKLEFARVVTDKRDRHGEFEVDDDKGVKVKVVDRAGKAKAEFVVGKISNQQTMIRAAGKDEVYGAVGSLKAIFGKDLRNWRDKEILEFEKDHAVRVEIASAEGTVTLARALPESDAKPKDEDWKVASAPIPIDQLDTRAVGSLLSSAYRLRASDFADDKKPADVGLDPPQMTVTVELSDGAKHVLQVGRREGEDTWVKVPDKPQVFVLKKYTAERIALPAIDLRDKTVLDLDDAEVVGMTIDKDGVRLTLAREGEAWKATPAIDPLDETRVKSAVSGVASLDASRFARDASPAATGLSRPAGVVTVKLAGGATHTVRIGSLDDEDDEYHLQLAGRPDVFRVKKYNVERFWKSPEDFKKKE